MSISFDTKIAVVLRQDLALWQRLNVTAFTISGIAATVPDVTGGPYLDASGNTYLPMLRQPVVIFEADAVKLRTVYERARSRGVSFSLFTEDLFSTNDDESNRAAVKAVAEADLKIVGIALRADKKDADKILKGLSLHQ